DGQTIVFELLGDLYTLPVSGGTATRIMGGLSFESQPVFSPDGSEIAFLSDRSGVENLWIANADGSGPRAVTKDGPTRDRPQLMVSPSWTADGQYLLVSRSRPPERTAAVFLIHRDGGTGVRLGDKPPEPTPGVPGAQPPNRLGAVASVDGRYVYFAERRGTFNYNAQFPIWQVVRFDRKTGEETTITSAPGSAMRPLLHPDGQHLVYATRHRTQTALRVRDLTTGEERWLVNGVTRDDQESRASRDTMPGYAFTPDGSALIATVDGGFRRIDFETGAMTAIPFEAQVEAEVAPRLHFPRRVDDGPTVTARIVRWPRVAPDASAVVFSAFSRLYRMDLGGGTPTRLTDSDEDEFMPAWSPDGSSIAYVTWSSSGGHLKTVGAAGGSGTALTADPAFYAEPAWNPAGDAIVIRRAPVKEHLYSFLRDSWGKTDLYADEDEIGGMRAAELSELLIVPAAGGDASVIGPAEGGRFPHFTSDPDRVYLTGSSAGLYSLRLDGTDRKTHLEVTGRGAGANPPPASQIMLSSDGARAFFELQNRHYLVEVPTFGKNTL
ncbi:MAG: amidohydrolase, partial [Acidobacteria bacterium]|nr:amidohydrolase [Acidobacteriota bacterium]